MDAAAAKDERRSGVRAPALRELTDFCLYTVFTYPGFTQLFFG